MRSRLIRIAVIIGALGSAGCGLFGSKENKQSTTTSTAEPSGDAQDQKMARAVVAGVQPLYDRLGNLESGMQSLQEGQKVTHERLNKVDYKVDVYGKESIEKHGMFEKVLAAIKGCLGACEAQAEKPAVVRAPAKPRAVVARAKPKPVVRAPAKAVAASTVPCPPTVVQPPPPAPATVSDEGRVPRSIFPPNAPTHFDWWKRERAEEARRQVYSPPPTTDPPPTVPSDQKKRCPDPCR